MSNCSSGTSSRETARTRSAERNRLVGARYSLPTDFPVSFTSARPGDDEDDGGRSTDPPSDSPIPVAGGATVLSICSREVGAPARAAFRSGRTGDSSLVDPASSHMLVSKIKPCMSQYKPN